MKKSHTQPAGDPYSGRRRPTHRYQADLRTGLTTRQVNEYLANGWDNTPVRPPSLVFTDILKNHVLTWFNAVFLLLTLLSASLGSSSNYLFLLAIFVNMVLSLLPELAGMLRIRKLASIHRKSRTNVLRNGKTRSIPSEDLVLDDLIILESGESICADAVVLKGEVQITEALLTGDSEAITRRPGDHLFDGGRVISGSCLARLTSVGEDTHLSHLILRSQDIECTSTPYLVHTLNRLLLLLGLASIPMMLLAVAEDIYRNSLPVGISLSAAIAKAVGVLPTGVFVLASVLLVVSIFHLSGKKVLVQNLRSIELLSEIDTLCIDKTGTLTEDSMQVECLHPLPGYAPTLMAPLDELIGDLVNAMTRDNSTMVTLQRHFTKHSERSATGYTSFSSALKYCSVTFGQTSYVLGAPEFVLRDDYRFYADDIMNYITKGCRVLVFSIYHGKPDGNALTGGVTPLCLVVLSNKLRKNALETFRFFRENAVSVKVLSGDNPVTAAQQAQQAGIPGSDSYVDARALDSEADLKNALRTFTVFGRVTPEKKRIIIELLKQEGHKVAMVGDGVNDLMALKEAHCSIAMGSGCESALMAADVVIRDNDLSRLTELVKEGQQVLNKLERSGSLFLVKNIFLLMTTLLGSLFQIVLPISHPKLLLITLFTIWIPGFLLAVIPDSGRKQRRTLTGLLLGSLPTSLTAIVLTMTMLLFGNMYQMDEQVLSAVCILLMCFVGFIILILICRPLNLYKIVILVLSVTGLFFCAYHLDDLFGIREVTRQGAFLLLIFVVLCEPVLRYLTVAAGKCSDVWHEMRDARTRRKNSFPIM